MLKAGMIIAERYEIAEKIGSGGMADVYRAKDHKLNRYVAVKVLKSEFRQDATFVKKFRSEAQAAAGLTHPNIVNVFDVGDDEGVYYIVMELIEGITLKEYIARKGRLSVKETTSIGIQACMGLEAAHNHGIVHRDVKPQNIIISTDGKVKVTDFGIARAASSNTISSNVMGSVHYSSPEQVRGGYSDEKSDIYSMGITLYEMITGRVPFDGDTTVAIAIKHLQEEMTAPSVYAPELPYSLEQIIYKCTQKSVDRRYQNMGEVIADLKHSLIDPQGDFVRLNTLDPAAKTVVISDKELGQIKKSPKGGAGSASEGGGRSDADEGEKRDRKPPARKKSSYQSRRRKKKKSSFWIPMIGMIVGALLIGVLIFFIGRAAGLIGGGKGDQPEETVQTVEETAAESEPEDTRVEVPDLSGKTETEARALTSEIHIGLQSLGEQNSSLEKGLICAQDIAAGTLVDAYTTVKYYISGGIPDTVLPDYANMNALTAAGDLERIGMKADVVKEYCYYNDYGYPEVDPGYVMYTDPEAGTMLAGGDTVTLVVSRGIDYGSDYPVPNVVGMQQNEAMTILGKFQTVTVTEVINADVPYGVVISQTPEAGSYVSPDSASLTVSAGASLPSAQETAQPSAQETAAEGGTQVQTGAAGESQTVTQTAPVQTVSSAEAAANGEVWKCTQKLNTPNGYNGGMVRLELFQDVDGQAQVSEILSDQVLTFPYQLDVTGAPGVPTGTIYLYEMVNGSYNDLGHYSVEFEKVN